MDRPEERVLVRASVTSQLPTQKISAQTRTANFCHPLEWRRWNSVVRTAVTLSTRARRGRLICRYNETANFMVLDNGLPCQVPRPQSIVELAAVIQPPVRSLLVPLFPRPRGERA